MATTLTINGERKSFDAYMDLRALLEHAFAESKPALAICFGVQSLNVFRFEPTARSTSAPRAAGFVRHPRRAAS